MSVQSVEPTTVPAEVAVEDVPTSADKIIAEMTENSRRAEEFAIKKINEAITRLENLRELVQDKHRTNVNSTISYIRLIEDGLREVQRLETAIDKVADLAIATA